MADREEAGAAMADFEVTIRIRNNHLKERRDRLGVSQKEMAAAIGIPHGIYAGLECMRLRPVCSSGWTKAALAIAEYYDVAPAELFPDSILAVEEPAATRKLSAGSLETLMTGDARRRLLPPESHLETEEIQEAVTRALRTLPPRHRRAVTSAFGIGLNEPATLEKIAADLGVTRERARQIVLRGMRRMREERVTFPERQKLVELARKD